MVYLVEGLFEVQLDNFAGSSAVQAIAECIDSGGESELTAAVLTKTELVW